MEAFTPEEADALLDGRMADPALARAFDGMRALAAAPVPAAGPLVAAMASAAVAKGGTLAYLWLLRPRGVLLAKLVIAAGAATGAGGAGLAATGTLPDPIQDRVANVVDGIGIDLPGGTDEGSGSPSEPAAMAPTTTTSTTRTTSSTTTSTTTATATTVTTTPGPGNCEALDAAITSATATGVPNDPAIGGARLTVTVNTTGAVESAAAHIGGVGEVPLTETAPGVWTTTLDISGGPERVGEMMLVSILGCGADELDIQMTVGGL